MEGLNDIRTAISSENIQLLQSYIATYRKKLEEVVFVDVYMWINGATADIPQVAVKQYEYGDLTALK